MNHGSRLRLDRGAGFVGTSAAFLVFLLLLFAAVQILFNLYATSMVTAAAHDAARAVAGYEGGPDRCAAVPAAERSFRDALGDYTSAGEASLTWTCADPDSVSVRVVARHPTILPARMAGLSGLGGVDRTLTVRVERER